MGLRGADDEVLLEAARRTDRVVVTQDEDFLRHHADGIPHAGVAYYKQGSRTVSQVLQALTQLHDVLTPNDAFGQILYL
jgi:predicted nuclease of predicted toxin-antitoxin system